MAVAIDKANAGTKASSGSVTTTLTTTAAIVSGAHAIVLLHIFAGALHTVSGGGLTWTQAHTVISGNIRISLWYAPCPAGLASSTNLTIGSLTGTTGDITAVISSYTGIDTSGTIVAFNGGTAATAGWATGTIAGNSGDAYIGGAGGDGTLRTSTPAATNGTTPTERQDFNSATSGGSVTLVEKIGGAASDSLAGTWSGVLTHVTVGAAFKPAAGGGAAPVRLLGSLGVGT